MGRKRRVFIDTNVLVYLLSHDARKAGVAEDVLVNSRLERVISTQVINEFVHTARRKANLEWSDIRFLVDTFREACIVEPLTESDQGDAFALAESYGYPWYDSLIVATALRSNASTLLSEDLQDGQRIESVKITNPFAQ